MKSPLERFRKRLTCKAYQRRRQTETGRGRERQREREGEMGFATCNFEAFSIVRWDFISIFFGFFSSYLFLVFFIPFDH